MLAKPTAATVLVDGKIIDFDAFNIKGSNYFKLRDMAFVLNGGRGTFEVGWDGASGAISISDNKPYTAVGGEMTGKSSTVLPAISTNAKMLLDGKEVALSAYNIAGSNYFKIRDIGALVGFGVTWDGTRNAIVIDTTAEYAVE